MATVYLAQDLRHGRQVAIKVLRPELAVALGPERFLREIGITARLDHPHIVPLLDSGEGGGLVYYVMPFVEGETLRQRLQRDKQLPIEDAIAITKDIAAALGYAHDRGILHRDIKPENVVLSGQDARVMDFGIAKAVSGAAGDLTETGIALGTPAYMSPEQLAGERDLDARSDLYALACVAYEMLAGQAPFTGPSVESLAYQHLSAAPPSVIQLRPAVPEAVGVVLQKALAKAPADRFNRADRFADALTGALTAAKPAPPTVRPWPWLLITAGLVVVAVAFVAWRARRPQVSKEHPSVAVLPFRNLGPPEEQYFADGITEEISARLSHISGLVVISRGSALRYKGSERSAVEIAAELGVRYILAGTVRTDRQPDGTGQARVTPQLVEVEGARDLSMDSYTTGLAPGEVFQTQSRIAERVAEALNVQLLAGEQRTVRQEQTIDPKAHDSYLLGRFQLNAASAIGVEEAIRHFSSAVAQDAGYAQAFAGLADAFAQVNFWPTISLPIREAYARAEEAARKAIALDDGLAEAHASLGNVLANSKRDWEGAGREFRRAIALDPNYGPARAWYSELLSLQKRYPEALTEIEQAVRLDPISPPVRHQRAIVLTSLGRYDDAVADEKAVLAIQPSYIIAHVWLAQIAFLHGNLSSAAREMLKTPGFAAAKAIEAYLADPGQKGAVFAAIAALDSPNKGLNAARQAWFYSLVGATDSVLTSLERVVRSQSTPGLYILRYPSVTKLVGTTSRYLALMAEVGLEP